MDERLIALENQSRSLKRALWMLSGVLLIVMIVAAFPIARSALQGNSDLKEVRTERLTIVDQAGNPIGTFGRDENGGFIQVGGGESRVTILAGKSGSVVTQHGNQMCYMSADQDNSLFKISNSQTEAAVKSTATTEECAFWVSSKSKGRVYLGINNDYGASGFLRSEEGQNAWDVSEKKPKSR